MNITLSAISTYDYIGDSLTTLNNNYAQIENFSYYLNISAYQLFEPMMNFYITHKNDFDGLISTVRQNSANWDSLLSLVTQNSSKWINPIVYIHPTLELYPINSTTLNSIVSSFSRIYPILNGTNQPFFVENQKAVIYYYTYSVKDTINDNLTLYSTERANCISQGSKTVSIQCQDTSNGSSSCKGSSTSCAGCAKSCSKTVSVVCNYPETGTSSTSRYIQAYIHSTFQDRYERELKGIVYTVKNCEWVFERNLI